MTDDGAAGAWPHGPGEMAGRIRSFDWAATPLGPIEGWSAQLRALVDFTLASPVGASLHCGARDRVAIYNDVTARVLGAQHPHALGRPAAQSLTLGGGVMADLFDRAFAGEAVVARAEPTDSEGRPRLGTFDLYFTPVRDETGAVAFVHSVGFDVSTRLEAERERAAAEAELRAREAELARAYRIAGVGGLVVDVGQDLDMVGWRTHEYRALHGLKPDQTREAHADWLARVHADDRPRVKDALAALRDPAERRLEFEYRILRPVDGEMRWIRANVDVERDAQGRARRLVGANVDVTAQKAVEAALRESEARLATLIEGIPQLLWRTDGEGAWTWVSPQWCAYTGLSTEESLGFGWLRALHPSDRGEALAAWHGAEPPTGIDMETRLLSAPEGDYRWFRSRALPVTDAGGAVVEWLGTSTDIHDLHALQERQGVLVAELQHRTRNLLGVIRSLADRTASGETSLESFLRRFRARLGALSRVNGLLSRLDTGQRIAFDELLRAELEAGGVLDAAASGRVVLAGPAGVRLRSAAVQIVALALHELVANALKYGALAVPEGRLSVRWRVVTEADGSRRLVIDWRESGVAAMPPPDAAPQGGGYGRELIERALPYQLRARTRYSFGPDGVQCTIELPIPA